MGRGLDNKGLKGSKLAMPFQGPIMERLTVGDMCVMGPNDANKHGKIGKTSWDTTTYALVMAHNVYNHIQAVQEINRLADIEYQIRPDVNYKDWFINRNKKKKTGLSDFVPSGILYFKNFVDVLFDPKNTDPYGMLNNNTLFLDYISFGDTRTATEFNTFFDHPPTVEEMAGMDDMSAELIELREDE